MSTLTVLEVTQDGLDRATTYNVDLSRGYGYLYSECGFGIAWPVPVSGIYFASARVAVEESANNLVDPAAQARNATRRLNRMPSKFRCDGGDALEWLEQHGIYGDAVWCDTCRDWLPGEELCEHCRWCNKIGWYSTPSEPCGCPDDKDHE